MAATPAEFCSTMRSVLLTNEEGKTRKLSPRVSTSDFHSRTRARAGIPDHNHEARQGRGTSPIPSGPISFVVEIYHGPPRLPFWQRSHGGRGGCVGPIRRGALSSAGTTTRMASRRGWKWWQATEMICAHNATRSEREEKEKEKILSRG